MVKRVGVLSLLLLSLFAVFVLLPSAALAFDVSGTVSYAGSKTGRIYITLSSDRGHPGTSIATPGAFTIRGVPSGSYMLQAYMDTANGGARLITSPVALPQQVDVTNAAVSGIAVTLNDPPQVTSVTAPASFNVLPGDGSALVFWEGNDMGNGGQAESFNLYWSSSSLVSPSNFSGSRTNIPYASATDKAVILSGLSNGSQLYFVTTAKIGDLESQPSAVIGPLTIGNAAGSFAVSGSITFPSVAGTVPLYLALVTANNNGPPSGVYLKKYAGPLSSPLAFSFPAVANGSYKLYSILDLNNNGIIDTGDYMTADSETPLVTVNNAPVANVAPALTAMAANADCRTNHWKNSNGQGYVLNCSITSAAKRPVVATLTSGPKVVGPIDIGNSSSGEFYNWFDLGSAVPAVNDTYTFSLLNSDGTSGTATGRVTGVVNAFADPTAPVGIIDYTAAPVFSWGAPSSPPAGYSYRVELNKDNAGRIWDTNDIPGSQTSAVYNFDGRAFNSALDDNAAYSWQIIVSDALGNQSMTGAVFSFPGASGFSIVTSSLPNVNQNAFYNYQLGTAGGLSQYNWSIIGGSLPTGLTLDQFTGTISGSTSATGSFPVTLQVTDSSVPPQTASREFTLNVLAPAPLTIDTAILANGTKGVGYSQQVGVSGGTQPYSFAVSGVLPSGLSLNSGNGQISGTPTAAGTFDFTIQVTDNFAATTSKAFSVTIAAKTSVSVSGAVSYSGSKAGRIYLTVRNGNGGDPLGTSIAAPGPFTIRGLPPVNNNYTVEAFMDSPGLGSRVQVSPAGSAGFSVNGNDVSGINVTLSDSASTAPAAPSSVWGTPGDGIVLLGWDKPRVNGVEAAESYDVYWGPTSSVSKTSNAGSRLNIPAGGDAPVVLDGLTNGSILYFIVVAKSAGVEGTASAPYGPVLVGAASGGRTVSGTVNFSGFTPQGALYVAVVAPHGDGPNSVFITRFQNPTAPQNFSLSGVPDGAYDVYAILDSNNDKLFGAGDITNDDLTPFVTVAGANVAGVNISLTSGNSKAIMTTTRYKSVAGQNEWHDVQGKVRGQLKRPVAVSLTGAPASSQIVFPRDIGLDDHGEFRFWAQPAVKPTVGEAYTFSITYADGTVASAVVATISGVLDSFPLNPQISGTVSTVPTFSWIAPAAPPSPYRYSLFVGGENGQRQWELWDIPGNRLSVVYGLNGETSAPLQVGSQYYWNLGVRDQQGNSAQVSSNFSPAVSGATADATPPSIQVSFPASGAADVPVDSLLSIKFSEPVDRTTLPQNPNQFLKSGSTFVTGTGWYDPYANTIYFRPIPKLLAGTAYSATLSGIKDLAGNVMTSITLGFTTKLVDVTPPQVVSYSPLNGATNVPVSTKLTIKFSEKVDSNTMPDPAKFLKAGSTFVPGTGSYDAVNDVHIFTPSAPLAYNTLYTAAISGVKDLTGNSLAVPLAFSFTTEAAPVPDTIPPIVTQFTIPAASNSLTIPVTAFAATDNKAVTGYYLAAVATPPLANAAGWSGSPQASYTFANETVDGVQTLYAFAKDAAGKVSRGVAAKVTLKTHAPVVTAVAVSTVKPAPLWSAEAKTIAGSTALVLKATATGGAVSYQYAIDGGEPSPVSVKNILTIPGNTMAVGSHTIVVIANDVAGNAGYSQAISVTVDNTPPVATVSAQPQGLVTAVAKTAIIVAGSGVVSYRYKLRFTPEGSLIPSVWGSYLKETAVIKPLAIAAKKSGLYELAVIGRDIAGNWQSDAAATTVSWTVDAVAPIGMISTINGSAKPLPAANPASLVLTYSGNPTEMSFSSDGITWGSWEPVATTRTYTVQGLPGKKNLAVRFRDLAGNISKVARKPFTLL